MCWMPGQGLPQHSIVHMERDVDTLRSALRLAMEQGEALRAEEQEEIVYTWKRRLIMWKSTGTGKLFFSSFALFGCLMVIKFTINK